MTIAVRIIPVILHKGGFVVKGKRFCSDRSLGSARQSVRIYNSRQVDEICVLDVSATNECRNPDFNLIRDLACDMFSPMTIGGGIRSIEHFRLALESGADKCAISTAAIAQPSLIEAAAKKIGSQSVVVSIDHAYSPEIGDQVVYSNSGRWGQFVSLVEHAIRCESLGAGEIILNCIDRDGMMCGYDLEAIRTVSSAVKIPVIACGGAGTLDDFRLALEAGAHAVAAGAIFAFTDTRPADVAKYLRDCGYSVRIP